MLVPPRRRGVEILDDPATDPALRLRSLRDVSRSNALLGGTHAVLSVLGALLQDVGPRATLLDVGTGLADIPRQARERARDLGVMLTTFGVDEAESLVAATRSSLDGGACADVRRLPFAGASVDVVTCSQLLHHFEDGEIPLGEHGGRHRLRQANGVEDGPQRRHVGQEQEVAAQGLGSLDPK